MKCYIYFIINKKNHERYVGQTTNFQRRKNEHLFKLSQNIHPNPKLQNAYNKYGLESFEIQKIQFDDISKEELDEQEVYYIKKYNSYEEGYNLTEGGTGGDTRSKLDFDQFCFAYFGNLKYDGMTTRTGKYLGVDSSCISAIRARKSYDSFRQRAEQLSEEEKEKYLLNFEEKLNLKEQKPWIKGKAPDEELTYLIMCVVSTYGRGTEAAILKKFGLSKGFVYHLMSGPSRQEIKEKYKKTPKEEIQNIGRKYFEEWNLQDFAKAKIKEKYSNLIERYKS